MQPLLPYILLILPAAFVAALYKKRFETVLPATLSGTILLLYLFAILGLLRPGFLVSVAVSALSLAGLVYRCVKKGFSPIREFVLTPGLLAFSLFCLLSILLSQGRLLSEWDEFSHWGLAAKNVYFSDALWRGDTSTLLFKSYPPAVTLLQYYFLQFAGAFQERILFRGIQFLMFACLCPVFSCVGRRDWKRFVTFFGIQLTLPLLFFKNAYALIYVDALMGVQLGYLLLLFFQPDGTEGPVFRSVCFALMGSVLVLTKPAGVGLLLLACVIIGLYLLISERPKLTLKVGGGEGRRSLLSLICPLLLAAAFFGSWMLYRSAVGADDGMWAKVSTFTWERLANLLRGEGEYYDLVVIRRFITRQLQRYSHAARQDISFLTWLLTLPALAVLTRDRAQGSLKKHALSISVYLLIGYVLYCLSLLYVYACCFNENEALNMLSCDRYVFTYLLACILLLSGLLITRKKTGRFFLYALMCVSMVIGLKNAEDYTFSNLSRNIREDLQDSAALPEMMDPGKDRVYYISEVADSFDYIVARYNMTPIPIDDKALILGVTPAPEAGALEAELLSGGYTYVYVYAASSDYAAPFAALFDEPVTDRTLYSVERTGDSIRLSAAHRFDAEQ